MVPASETRVPVAVLNTFQLLCPLAITAVGWRLPANEVYIDGTPAAEMLFRAYNGGPRLLIGTIVCAVLGLIQLAVIRDPTRGSARHKWGLAVAALAVVAGSAVAYGAYQVGFTPAADYYETRPLAGTYVGLFGGAGFAVLAILRLMRFFEPEPAPLAAPPTT